MCLGAAVCKSAVHRHYSKVQKYVDSSSVNNDPTAAGEDCILASLERPNYRLYYNKTEMTGRLMTTGRRLIPHGMQRVPGYHLCEEK